MRIRGIITAAIVALWGLTSCSGTSTLLHDGDVVARVGSHKLFKSELEAYIPDGTSTEDSTSLALQYINTWATNQLFLDMAQQKLSKSQKDVSAELDDYKTALLKYRYEQMYINERLDTSISQQEISEYYSAHSDKFRLEVPIVKARFMTIAEDSPVLEILKKKMSSDDVEDLVEASNMAYSSAMKYTDYSQKWIDAIALSKEFGVDYSDMLTRIHDRYIEIPDGHGNVSIAYIAEIMNDGEIAPLDYCSDRIKDVILSARKHALVTNLEQDLLNDARNKENFVIY
jgi:hypothetical protein